MCPIKKGVLKHFAAFTRNTCVGVFFKNKVASPSDCFYTLQKTKDICCVIAGKHSHLLIRFHSSVMVIWSTAANIFLLKFLQS